MRGQLIIGGHHDNRLRCIVKFSTKYLYMLMQSVYNQLWEVMFISLKLLPWKQSLKKQVFKK